MYGMCEFKFRTTVFRNRVCLGSDYSFPFSEHEPGELIESMPFNSQVKEKLLSGAALEWLGMKREKFL